MIDFNFENQKYKIIKFFQKEEIDYKIMKEFINFVNSINGNKLLFGMEMVFNIASEKIEEKVLTNNSNLNLFVLYLPTIYISSTKDCIEKYNKFKKLKGFI